jgi:hypothetical protein
VKIERDFAAVIRTGYYHVFLMPNGSSNGLYVSRRNTGGFVVREQNDAKNNLKFSYRIVAKRKDLKAERLAKITLPATPSRAAPYREAIPPRRRRRASES